MRHRVQRAFLRGVRAAAVTAVVAVALAVAGVARGDGPSREFQLKAACVVNFVQFVRWPAGAFASAEAPLVITVLGDNPFGTILDRLAAGRNVGGRPIVVRYVRAAADVGPTHVLYVAGPAAAAGAKDLGGTGVLTVADADGFTRAGGCIRFLLEDNRVRFEINPAAVRRAGLEPTAKLMQLARVYQEE